MLLPLLALEEYVKIKLSVEKLAEKLLLSGTKVEEIKKINGEIVFDLEITPNRADTLSFYGIAREVAALLDLDLEPPDTNLILNSKIVNRKIPFKVANKKLCPYYSLVKLENISIKPSPNWIAQILKLSGIRPLNNVIDITNLVMLELGQPMHAFDAAKIKGIPVVRAAKKSEVVVTLDNVERKLPEGAIIIEDGNSLIDLAGLMGGKSSEIDLKTKAILLLVPFYDPVAIRKTSLFTGLRTEASSRFEKKLDPNMHPTALNRAIKLLTENAGATFASTITTVGFPEQQKTINFDTTLVKQILGIDLQPTEIVNILSPLGFRVSSQPLNEETMSITIPSHRPDVSLPEDILEELGRIYGYNNFLKNLPSGEIPLQKELFEEDTEHFVREKLINYGYFETTGYSLVSEADLKKIFVTPEKTIKVLHPTSSDFVFLRPSLIINLLKAIQVNQKHLSLAFFEIAKEFSKEIDPKTNLPKQDRSLSFISTRSFGQVKAETEALLKSFAINFKQEALPDEKPFSYGTSYKVGEAVVAQVAIVSPEVLDNFEIILNTTFAWLDFEYLAKQTLQTKYLGAGKFPSVFEDISFFVDQENLASKIVEFIEEFDELLVKAWIIDAFKKENKLSLAVRLEFQNPRETLTSKVVEKIRLRLEKDLTKKFRVKVRQD